MSEELPIEEVYRRLRKVLFYVPFRYSYFQKETGVVFEDDGSINLENAVEHHEIRARRTLKEMEGFMNMVLNEVVEEEKKNQANKQERNDSLD